MSGGWNSAFHWSSWSYYKQKAKDAWSLRQQHENKKVPCEKCAEARRVHSIGSHCDYWYTLWKREDGHKSSASNARVRARREELKEGKEQTVDGVKLEEEYRRELDAERERKWQESETLAASQDA